MTLTDHHKKALLIFGAGFLLFALFKPKFAKTKSNNNLRYTDEEPKPSEREIMKAPTMSAKTAAKNPMAKNAFAALKAYIDAYNNGETQSVLDELNREFAKEFNVKVYRRKSDRKLIVTDLDGKEIMVNNG